LETFAHRSRHQLYEDSSLIKSFIDPLRPIEKLLLEVLDLPQDLYLEPNPSTLPPAK
jgi:hypothetical protein